MIRILKKISILIYSILIIFKNIFYLNLFLRDVLILKKNVFPVPSGAIGHFPLSIYIAKKLYGINTIFFYKKNAKISNKYLEKKLKKTVCFDQKYSQIYEIMTSLKKLTFGFYNYNELPEHMFMGKNLNFSKSFQDGEKLFEFNSDEDLKGNNFLKKNNINKENFVCFIVRTAEYNKIYGSSQQAKKEDDVRKFFNVDQESYILSLRYLVDSDCSVIRMGKGFSNPFPFKHKNFFDYAISEDRNDFLDVWLSANCKFFFGTTNGIISLPALFYKPILGTNQFPIGSIMSYLPNSVNLPRIAKKNGNLLNLQDHVNLGIIRTVNGVYYKQIEVDLLENDPEDILNGVKDIENKINNGFHLSNLNILFWKNLEKTWNKNSIQKKGIWEKRYFEDFHKINGISASIPDFYLKKYKKVFIE